MPVLLVVERPQHSQISDHLDRWVAGTLTANAQIRDERRQMAHQIVFLRPRTPYAQWAKQFIEKKTQQRLSVQLVLSTLGESSPAYMIPLLEGDRSQAVVYVEENYQHFFQKELEQWCTDSFMWPKDITFPLFRRWFELEIYDMVLDMTDAPIATRRMKSND